VSENQFAIIQEAILEVISNKNVNTTLVLFPAIEELQMF
jgi:hypothetical protein